MSKPHKNYTLDGNKPLGVGGQAVVRKACDKRDGTIIAFKQLLPTLRRDEESLARMRREIEVQTKVKHRNIMPILDHSESFYWYTMPIANNIFSKLSTPMGDDIIINVIKDCANGLMEAHERGYVHRDITPNNILLIDESDDTRWVVSDWGLVRKRGYTTAVRTLPGRQLGTEGFSAPETWKDAHNVDKRADVYGLGRVIAWSLTGEWPAPNLPLLPTGLWKDFVSNTTDIDPNKRPKDMYGVLRLLEKVVNHL